jgi:hypothetical protein
MLFHEPRDSIMPSADPAVFELVCHAGAAVAMPHFPLYGEYLLYELLVICLAGACSFAFPAIVAATRNLESTGHHPHAVRRRYVPGEMGQIPILISVDFPFRQEDGQGIRTNVFKYRWLTVHQVDTDDLGVEGHNMLPTRKAFRVTGESVVQDLLAALDNLSDRTVLHARRGMEVKPSVAMVVVVPPEPVRQVGLT